MKRLTLNFFLVVMIFALCNCDTYATDDTPKTTSPSEERHAVEHVDRTLSNRGRFPWYDSESGTLRFIPPYVPKNATSPNKEREPKPKTENNAKTVLSTL
ncbi:MAG: hypothetical protein Q4G59_11740, partial [Planctomycetia bacterium]|nr:hypothetical protein [Planctomycetia bacterium]